MSKLFHSAPRVHTFHRHILSTTSLSLHLQPPPSSSLLSPLNFSISRSFPLAVSPISRRDFSARATSNSNSPPSQLDSKPSVEERAEEESSSEIGGPKSEEYPSGEFEYKEFGAWKCFVVKCRMLVAYPWQRVKKGSVYTMKLRGQISDQLKSRFSQGLSLPQICENLIKAAYDPRISGVYLHIEPLNCGWGKVEEIRRHILDFRKSGLNNVGFPLDSISAFTIS